MTLHSVTNPRFLDYADAFRMAAACFVHRVSDVDKLKAAGVKNVYHIDQGIPAVSASVRHPPTASNSSTMTIASFGPDDSADRGPVLAPRVPAADEPVVAAEELLFAR